MSKESEAQSGRIAYDEHGQPVWEWRVDTVAKEPPAPQEQPSKPQPPRTRRTLDDMRALSEEIKKKRPKK